MNEKSQEASSPQSSAENAPKAKPGPLKRVPDRHLRERFVAEYVKDLNATQAAIRAGYSEQTAHVQSSRLLKNVNVSAEIERKVKDKLHAEDVKADEVIREAARIMRFDLAPCFDESGNLLPIKEIPEATRRAVSSYRVWYDKAGNRCEEIKAWNKNQALETLGKYFKLWAPDQIPERQVLIQFLNVPAPDYAIVDGTPVKKLPDGK